MIKKIMLLSFGFAMGSIVMVHAGHAQNSGAVYNQNGVYQGRINSHGQMYNQNGSYKGRMDPSGNVYNSNGSYKGHVDPQRKESGLPLLK